MNMPKTNQRSSHPLVGAGLHWKGPDGDVINQAQVVAVFSSGSTAVGDVALLQYFEWFMGEPSTRRLIPVAELASSDRWVLYPSVEVMNDHYERVDERRNRVIQEKKAELTPDGPKS